MRENMTGTNENMHAGGYLLLMGTNQPLNAKYFHFCVCIFHTRFGVCSAK